MMDQPRRAFPLPSFVPPVLLVAAALVVAAGQVSARQEQVFRTGTKTVPVYVTVTDATGRLVPDLVRDDFAIDDNGVPQPITVFANEIQPITVVLLLDRSVSVALEYRHVQAAAEQFVMHLLPADKARVGSFSDAIKIDPPDFTSDHDALLYVLRNELLPIGPTPLWNAIDAGMTALAHEAGRRVVLVFTDGVDSPGNLDVKRVSLKDVLDQSRREDVMVYGVGLAGRSPMQAGGGGGFGWSGQGRATERKPDPGLARIAAETGGGYFELTSAADLASTFARVADELHRQYALGFTPSVLDGKVHRIEVRLKPEGMKARARQSYLASPETTSGPGSGGGHR